MKLYAGDTYTGVWLSREELFPTMWRVCAPGLDPGDERKSPMMPLDRARDTAVVWARFKHVDNRENLHWRTDDARWREGGTMVPLGSE